MVGAALLGAALVDAALLDAELLVVAGGLPIVIELLVGSLMLMIALGLALSLVARALAAVVLALALGGLANVFCRRHKNSRHRKAQSQHGYSRIRILLHSKDPTAYLHPAVVIGWERLSS